MKSRKPFWIDRKDPKEVVVRAKDGQLIVAFSVAILGEEADKNAKEVCHNLNKHKEPQ
jgi:hypothetical protein